MELIAIKKINASKIFNAS